MCALKAAGLLERLPVSSITVCLTCCMTGSNLISQRGYSRLLSPNCWGFPLAAQTKLMHLPVLCSPWCNSAAAWSDCMSFCSSVCCSGHIFLSESNRAVVTTKPDLNLKGALLFGSKTRPKPDAVNVVVLICHAAVTMVTACLFTLIADMLSVNVDFYTYIYISIFTL